MNNLTSVIDLTLRGFSEEQDDLRLYSGAMPNFRFNVTMSALFGLFTIYHAFVGAYTRQWWFGISFMCGSLLETLGYVGRSLSHSKTGPQSDYFILQIVCLTIAPVFTMAGIYYQLAKLIEIYGHSYSLLPTPISYSYIFIFSDFASLVIQAIGGGTSASAVKKHTSTSTGDSIFVVGLSVQVASMTVFLTLWLYFLYEIYVKARANILGQSHWNWKSILRIKERELDSQYRQKYAFLREGRRWCFRYFNLALTAAVLCVFVRCCYRVAELAQGWNGFLISHEWYFIILDALMMSIATLVLSIFHPGFAFMGRSAEIKMTSSKEDIETSNSDMKKKPTRDMM